MPKRSKRSTRSIALPWERRGAWIRELLAGRRWKVILGMLLGGVALLIVARSAEQRQRERETRTAIAEIKRSIASFRADMGRCPHTLHELLHPPRSGRRYLRQIPVDGWGHAFWVRCPGRYDPEGADVVSAGPSGNFLVDDNLQ
ncbi:MAG TPA: type II secretion system protein GspG [Sandaracinaceae bacterium LLY-WYZ-13_1]|nr:type II secretion system protein GspG [Sandaracinaceae bacterium LLY-WYZ-13_1]